MTSILKAFPDLLSAALLFALWAEPERFGIEWFRSGVLALMLEFFVIHAGGFMAVTVTDPEATPRAIDIGAFRKPVIMTRTIAMFMVGARP